MNSSIGASRIANTIFINHSARKFGLLELSSKCSILKKFFACISWIPELNRSSRNSNKSKIIWFSRPLDVKNSIVSCWKLKKHFFSLDIINVHCMLIALVNSCNISLARTDWKSGYSFCLSSKLEACNRLHSNIVPNMNSWQFSAFSCYNNVSKFTASGINGCYIILVIGESLYILICISIFFSSSKKLLLSSSKILYDSKSSTCKNDLIVILSEM